MMAAFFDVAPLLGGIVEEVLFPTTMAWLSG
jgi:hypothetical protein